MPLRQVYHKIKIYPSRLPQDKFKKQKYDRDYLKFGFTEATDKRQIVRKCVICVENLGNDALRPSRLQRNLRAKHPGLQDKNLAFSEAKEELFKSCFLFDHNGRTL